MTKSGIIRPYHIYISIFIIMRHIIIFQIGTLNGIYPTLSLTSAALTCNHTKLLTFMPC